MYMSNNNKKEQLQNERFEKFIEDNRASSKKYCDDYCERNRNYYAEGLLAGESANGGVPDEIVNDHLH